MRDPVWERQPGESREAFRAFCIYRDLEVIERTYDSAFRIGCPNTKAKRCSGRWRLWASDWKWIERAEAYDAHKDRMARAHREAEHRTNLESYYEEKRKAASAISKAALELLIKAHARLNQVKVEDIPIDKLPAFLRAAASLYDAAGNAQAESLAVDQILGVINNAATTES
jgi:hypothetical protein